MDAADFHPSEVPAKPGIYVFRDRFGEVIYVGKARELRRRLSSYFQPSRRRTADPKLRSLINSIAGWSYEVVRSEDEALILESRLIKSYAPRYNVLMRDDKRYPLLVIDWNEEFPTLKMARVKKPGNLQYFGPFPQGSAVKMTLEFILRHFGLRACRDSAPDAETRKRCLKRIVKDCCAPCTGAVSSSEYRKRVDRALEVLSGNLSELQNELEELIRKYAASEKFEQAARYRDVLFNLKSVFGRRNRSFENPDLPEVSPGMRAVADLQRQLGITVEPKHIVGFDISNLFGTQAVASMVCFVDGLPSRSNYRRFRIKSVDHSDDFAMMSEAVSRHFSALVKEKRKMPDLVLIDGGKGQLSSAINALVSVGAPPLPILGLAEKNEEVYLPGKSEPIVLSRHSDALQLLQSVRDEAHRFAVSYHRVLRRKRIEHSRLDEVPGIGENRKKALLKNCGSLSEIRKLDASQLAAKVPGLGIKLAQKVLDALG
jgi:excinuclease ABC subunit C